MELLWKVSLHLCMEIAHVSWMSVDESHPGRVPPWTSAPKHPTPLAQSIKGYVIRSFPHFAFPRSARRTTGSPLILATAYSILRVADVARMQYDEQW